MKNTQQVYIVASPMDECVPKRDQHWQPPRQAGATEMKRTSVTSSNLSSVGYDPERSILEIEFHGGRVYQYYNVPIRVYDGLMNAASHGRYHHQNIKNRYRYNRIS